jgi:hypothetical protein
VTHKGTTWRYIPEDSTLQIQNSFHGKMAGPADEIPMWGLDNEYFKASQYLHHF